MIKNAYLGGFELLGDPRDHLVDVPVEGLRLVAVLQSLGPLCGLVHQPSSSVQKTLSPTGHIIRCIMLTLQIKYSIYQKV